jgi:AcrR family transcriptional regulator
MADEIRLASRRERHKDRRRAEIIDAAYDLLREVGADDLSVKMIADRADVSAATIYNLFGSKGAVLEQVYARDFEAFVNKVAAAGAPSALDEVFEAIRIVAGLYRADPSFYRGMTIRNPRAEPELVISVQGPRQAFWRRLLERAVRERDLASGTRTDLLSMAMLQLGGGAFGAWVADLITIEEMELQTSYGLARLLLSVARPVARARLQARIAIIEAALSPESHGPEPALQARGITA